MGSPSNGELAATASIQWIDSFVPMDAHEIVILPSGWLRVTNLNGTTSHVSPASVRLVVGKGVSYGA